MPSAFSLSQPPAAVALLALAILCTFLVSRLAARQLRELTEEADEIRAMRFDRPLSVRSPIAEIDALATTMGAMKSTIRRFLEIGAVLAGERNFERLLDRILIETMRSDRRARRHCLFERERRPSAAPWRTGGPGGRRAGADRAAAIRPPGASVAARGLGVAAGDRGRGRDACFRAWARAPSGFPRCRCATVRAGHSAFWCCSTIRRSRTVRAARPAGDGRSACRNRGDGDREPASLSRTEGAA